MKTLFVIIAAALLCAWIWLVWCAIKAKLSPDEAQLDEHEKKIS